MFSEHFAGIRLVVGWFFPSLNEVAGDHFVVTEPGCDHWIDSFVRVYYYLEESGAVEPYK